MSFRSARFPRVLALYILVGSACTNPMATEEYVIDVESVEVTDTARAGDTVAVRLLGRVGPDGCHNLEEVRVEPTDDGYGVTAIGSVREVDGCSGILPRLDVTIGLEPPHPSPIEIAVARGEGRPPIRRTVTLLP